MDDNDRKRIVYPLLVAALKAAYDELAAVDMLRAKQDDGRTIGEVIDHALEVANE